VFFGWKGINCVRQWLIPANPQSATQGDQRVIIGGTGRACGKIGLGEDYAQQLIDLELIPAQQTKQSWMVKYIFDTYIYNTTTYTAQLALCTGHTSYADFGTAADTLGITEFDLAYASVAAYDKALGVFLLAKAGIDQGFTGTPYSVAITAWTGAQIDLLVSDLAG